MKLTAGHFLVIVKDQYSHLMQQNCDSIGPSKMQENNERKTPLLHEFVCFQMSNASGMNLKSFNFNEKFPLSQKLCYFRVSHFMLSTALRCSKQSKVLCFNLF